MRHAYHNGTTTATEHRQKRQFQPSITTYFAREDRDLESSEGSDFEDWGEEQRGSGPIPRSNTNSHHHHSTRQRASNFTRERDTCFPTPPGQVQADLLSVGMRVRKAVPEGYKQHKTSSSTTPLPTIQTTLATTNLTSISTNISSSTTTITREPVPGPLLHQRELLPFCGLHKIGGFAEQPTTNLHLYGGGEDGGAVNIFPLPAEAFNQPFSSQDSSTTSFSTESLPPNPTNPYKRSWRDENETASSLKLNASSNFLFALPHAVQLSSEDEVPVSPLSETPTQSINAFRTFAQPKTRRQQYTRLADFDGAIFKESDTDMEIENAGRSEVRSPNDFDEADFLRPTVPWTAREVEMGGMG